MGVAVINSTLSLIFKDRSAAAEELWSTFDGLVIFKTDNAKSHNDQAFWEGAGGSSIALNDFLDFVVQPHVATLLIMEDLRMTEKEAEETRIISKKYGLKFNFEIDDGRVDEITMENARISAARIPGKFRRKEIVSSKYFHQEFISTIHVSR